MMYYLDKAFGKDQVVQSSGRSKVIQFDFSASSPRPTRSKRLQSRQYQQPLADRGSHVDVEVGNRHEDHRRKPRLYDKAVARP